MYLLRKKMMDVSLILTMTVAVTLSIQTTSVSCRSPAKRDTHYRRCKKGDGVFKGNVIKTMTSPRVRCFESCSQDDNCRSVNVCPLNDGDESTCHLLDQYSPHFCENLKTTSKPDCFHAEKTSCGNGRPGANGMCVCDICYKGDKCGAHVRDCKEAVQVLSPDSGYDLQIARKCWIKPTAAPKPFLVKCHLSNEETELFLRVQAETGYSNLQWQTQSWNDYERGLSADYNFFVGLENMHHFLRQASYRLNLYTQFHDESSLTMSYMNLTVGNEADRFALSYAHYTNSDKQSPTETESFKAANVPHEFCTLDNDRGNCAKDKGPGWYFVSNCVGNSPFAKPAKWPSKNGSQMVFKQMEFNMERDNEFYQR